ncbi:MAG: hypothetical protein KC668_14545 [Myxococcales bacterium]|nr:hypothetical protein [Myxococcales bacterium]
MNGPESNAPGAQATRAWVRGALLFALGGLAGGGLSANLARPPHGTREVVFQAADEGDEAASTISVDGAADAAEGAQPGGASMGVSTQPSEPERRALLQRPLRFLAVGGGADPVSTQVQLEQDVDLFARTLAALTPGPGATLFAGGSSVRAVQVLDGDDTPLATDAWADLRAALGDVLDPRAERAATYRLPAVPVHGEAEAARVLELIATQIAEPGERLELFIACHGDQGDTPADNYVALWGDSAFDARELAGALAPPTAQRGARVLLTACFGGGFAELAFEGADSSAGPAASDVCGLFATSAEHESSGCDPNPDRQAQEGYALHVLHALRGEGRDGAPLSALDLDGDGIVGMLEAHTQARVASRSIDLPSTTSERYLRSLAAALDVPSGTPASSDEAYATPEEDAVIRALGALLGIASEGDAESTRAMLETQLGEAAARVEALGAEEDEAQRALVLRLAERWPELLDPFRADFERTLRRDAPALRLLLRSAPAASYQRARRATDRALLAEENLRLRWVQVMRLARAFETRRLARALAATRPLTDPARQHYEALLSCERAPLARR